MSGTALVQAQPVVKPPVVSTTINLAFSMDDMVHLAVEQQMKELEKKSNNLYKVFQKEAEKKKKVVKIIENKMKLELENMFATEIATIKKVFPKYKPYVKLASKDRAFLEMYNYVNSKPMTLALKSLSKELEKASIPCKEACEEYNKCKNEMNRADLTSKFRAKMAKIKLKELKSHGVDLFQMQEMLD